MKYNWLPRFIEINLIESNLKNKIINQKEAYFSFTLNLAFVSLY